MKIFNSYEYVTQMVKGIKPKFRYEDNDDFLSWKNKAKDKINELLGLPYDSCEDNFKVLKTSNCDGYKRIEFEFQSETNYYVTGVLLIPDTVKETLPTMICLQGHSSGMHISLDEPKFKGDAGDIAGGRDFAVRAVKEGYCAVVIDQRYMGAAGQNEKGTPACFTSFEAMPTLLLGRCAVGERVWDVQRLIDILIKYFSEYVDKDNIICMGNSGGGTTTFYASCLDERISLAVPSCSVCTYDDSIIAMSHCNCNYIPGIRKFFEMGDIGMLMSHRKLLVVCGKDDPIFPLSGVEKSFKTIKKAFEMVNKADNCKMLIGNGGHQFYPDDAWPIIHNMIGK